MARKPQGSGVVPVSDGTRPSRELPDGRKPSITDVARIAGVSYQTVSRVINAAPDVSAETRARVLKIIQEVGYRRNMTATTLVTSRSTVIGIVTDGSPDTAQSQRYLRLRRRRASRATGRRSSR